MTLKARIANALKSEIESGKGGVRLATLRLIDCAVRDRDVCARGRGVGEGCPDADVRRVLETMIAQRELSAREHEDGGLIEDAIRERDEIEIIQQFLPELLHGEALETAVEEVVSDLGASKLKDLGRCMSTLKERYPGLIETGEAGKAMRKALSRAS
ncbi:MAG: GatB/YqeY domain-containing protein [Hyphomonas sp.]